VLIKTLIRGMPSLLAHIQILQLQLKIKLASNNIIALGGISSSAGDSSANMAAAAAYAQINSELHALQVCCCIRVYSCTCTCVFRSLADPLQTHTPCDYAYTHAKPRTHTHSRRNISKERFSAVRFLLFQLL